MNQKITRQLVQEIVSSQILGQKRKEVEFEEITKGLIEFYYGLIECDNKKTYIDASYNWITKNIMTVKKSEDYIPWVIQISTVCALCTDKSAFLENSKIESLKKGISYPYLSLEQDNENFIPKSMDDKEKTHILATLFNTDDLNLRMLAGLFFLGGLSVTEISEYTEGKITNIAAGIAYLKDRLTQEITNNQKTPDDEYESLSEHNIILESFENNFYLDFNDKHVTIEKEKKEASAFELKMQMLSEIKETAEPERPQEQKEEIIMTPVVEKTEPPKKVNEENVKDEEKSEKKISKISDARYYALIGAGAAIAVVLLITFIYKVVNIIVDKNAKTETEVAEEIDETPTIEENETSLNEQEAKLSEAYENQVGTVSIVLSGTTSEAPKNISDDTYYFFGSNYEFDLQYNFSEINEETSIVDCAEVSLEYNDRTEHVPGESYEERKSAFTEDELLNINFDDANHTITTFEDWSETNQHTAYDYDQADCVTTWLSVLDGNRSAIESMGDGCDLLPVMADNLTTTVNGQTYELVFYNATGYFIKDDDTDDNEGHSTNYTIVCDAYLETF